MGQAVEAYVQSGVEAVFLEVEGFAARADNNSALDKVEQRVTETATMRHVLALHLLLPAYLECNSPSLALCAPETVHSCTTL